MAASLTRLATSLAFAIGLAWHRDLHAQAVRGVVTQLDGRSPVAGAVVAAITVAGVIEAQTLTDTHGRYDLAVRSGRYRLRVLRIGYQPYVSEDFDVAQIDTTSKDLALPDSRLVLDTVRTVATDGCRAPSDGSATLVALWEQARGALSALRLTEQRSRLQMRVLSISGSVDMNGGTPSVDSLSTRDLIVNRLFGTTSADTLAREGYIRLDSAGRVRYEVPTADVLLSDSFLEAHCFELQAAPRSEPRWIGIRFAPKHENDDVSDIRGVLWLDRGTAALRRLEFEYTRSRFFTSLLCGHIAGEQRCMSNITRGRGSGGSANFRRLVDGGWLISDWTVRTPAESLQYTRMRNGQRVTGPGLVPCNRGVDCIRPYGPSVRVSTSMGQVVLVRLGADTLYANDSAAKRLENLHRLRAGRRPAGMEGVVTDDNGIALAGAVVQTSDPVRTVVTDSAGRFALGLLPVTNLQFRVRCAGYRSVSLAVPLLPDSTRRVRITLPAQDTSGSVRETRTACEQR